MLLLIYDHYSFYAVHILIYVNVKDVKINNDVIIRCCQYSIDHLKKIYFYVAFIYIYGILYSYFLDISRF